ncbi:hypothetical protein FB451DRAFT_1370182 [Mycena latifolia]|nr:hypothetical protein FB451DRAFT_1370182 [Mycena latifolia]
MASMPDPSALQKAEALWFSPEVVILRAQTRIFRVFVAILKEKSSVFADMFAFPQPPSSDMETMEGSPVVTVHDDPEDMEVFLKAMFDAEFFITPPAEARFRDIIGILRLSHKYDVPFLRNRSLKYLGLLYHTRLSEHEEPDLDLLFKIDFISYPSDVSIDLTVINVAAETGALWLLPVAYYEACRFPIQTIMTAGVSWDGLGEAHRIACIIGHSAQVQLFPNIIAFHFAGAEELSDCTNRMQCGALQLVLAARSRMLWEMKRPLETVDDDYCAVLEESGLCSSCLTRMGEIHRTAKQTFWDGLPGMFGLPGWAELEKMRRAQLGE